MADQREALIQALQNASAAADAGDQAAAADARRLAEALHSMGGGTSAQATGAASAASTPAPVAGALETGLSEALNAATMGLSRRGAAFLDSLTGTKTYQQALALREQQAAADNAANPVSGWVGWGAGSLAGGGLLGVAGRGLVRAGIPGAARVAEAVTPKAADTLRQSAQRLAGAGALGGAAEGLATGAADTAFDAATGNGTGPGLTGTALRAAGGGTVGAIAGPLAGGALGAAGAAGRFVTDRLQGAREGLGQWRLLARKLDADPDELRIFADEIRRRTGQEPNMAMLLQGRQAGVIREIAEANPEVMARRLAAEREAAERALPGQYAQRAEEIAQGGGVVPQGRPLESAAGLDQARRQADEAFFQAPGPVPGTTRADMPVHMDRPTLDRLAADTEFIRAQTPAGSEIRQTVSGLQQAAANPQVTRYSGLRLADVEEMRGALREAHMAGGAGARQAARAADAMRDAGGPAYAAHTAQTAARHDYKAGFDAGFGGDMTNALAAGQPTLAGQQAAGAASGLVSGSVNRAQRGGRAAVQELHRVESDQFQQALGGYAPQVRDELTGAARAFRQGQEALDTMAPSLTSRQLRNPDADATANLADAAIGAVGGSLVTAGHAGKRILARAVGSPRMSPAMQGRLMDDMLSRDPIVRDRAIERLRQAGASLEWLARARQMLAAGAGDAGQM